MKNILLIVLIIINLNSTAQFITHTNRCLQKVIQNNKILCLNDIISANKEITLIKHSNFSSEKIKIISAFHDDTFIDFPWSYDIHDSVFYFLNAQMSGKTIFKLNFIPLDSISKGKMNIIDTSEYQPKIKQGVDVGKIDYILNKYSKQTLSNMLFMNDYVWPPKYDGNYDIFWDFSVVRTSRHIHPTIENIYFEYYLLHKNELSVWNSHTMRRLPHFFAAGGAVSRTWEKIKSYPLNYKGVIRSIRRDSITFLLTDTVIYKIKPDTILRTGKIIKDTLQKETIVSKFFIDDKDNKEIILFPPYYFVKENEDAPKIRTLKSDEETYKLTVKMAEMYFKEENEDE